MSWLLDHLIASGHVTETGLTRRAKIRTCGQIRRDAGVRRKCLDRVLVGLDSDVCAFEVACDPQPLSRLGEALALVDGRRTLTLRREGGGWVLDGRDAHQISWAPAGERPRQDVVAIHRCGSPIPAAWSTTTTFPEATPSLPANATPPF